MSEKADHTEEERRIDLQQMLRELESEDRQHHHRTVGQSDILDMFKRRKKKRGDDE